MNLNRAMIIGNLTRDPETKTTPSGQTVTSFSIATNRIWTDKQGQKQEAVEYHNIVAWGKLAEICSQYLGKGRKVYIEGRLQTRNWTDQSGVTKYRTEIVAENMIMLDRAPAAGAAPIGNTPSFNNNLPPQETPAPAQEMQAQESTDGEEEIKVENIPF